MTLLTRRDRHRDFDKMRSQGNFSQKEEQDNATARYLSKTDISNMPDVNLK